MAKSKSKVEFGDFQTPIDLAVATIQEIPQIDSYYKIIEPTCGVGTFLTALLINEVASSKLEGWEINPTYVDEANRKLSQDGSLDSCSIVKEQDFFSFDFSSLDVSLHNYLFIGNPPWVTNSELGKLLSENLPEKANFQGLTGLEAMTGKSNFDISEWMIIQLLKVISGSHSSIAFLIKTSVARKLFEYSCKNNLHITNFKIKVIDAKRHFDVSVDACLFYASGCPDQARIIQEVKVYSMLDSIEPNSVMGFSRGKLVSNIISYEKYKEVDSGSEFKWRSGVKHDASKVMEFDLKEQRLVNGLGEICDIPDDYLYPMYKSSHISKEKINPPVKKMLVTQQKIGEETKGIESLSKGTWDYLCSNSEKLDSRKSSIYKSAPRFSVFGVGEYTFKPWKVVISGLYKNTRFTKIGCHNQKPIVVDDTCYMLGFDTEEEADYILSLLSSEPCQEFIRSIIFFDNKRPITVALLSRINMKKLSDIVGSTEKYLDLFSKDDDQPMLL